jgi:DNA-binding GntR family transcriptional regulator
MHCARTWTLPNQSATLCYVGIDRGAADYLYIQLANVLRDRIQSGRMARGSRIPSLDDLVAEFDLAEMTVRRAIGVLISEGLIETRAGRGTYVTRALA